MCPARVASNSHVRETLSISQTCAGLSSSIAIGPDHLDDAHAALDMIADQHVLPRGAS
jgi:hypothetical protein